MSLIAALALLIPGAAGAGNSDEPPPDEGTPVTVPTAPDPTPPPTVAPDAPNPASSITVTLAPVLRQGPIKPEPSAKPTPATTTAATPAPSPAAASSVAPRATGTGGTTRRIDPAPSSRPARSASPRIDTSASLKRTAKQRDAAGRKAAEKRRQATRRARVAARQKTARAPFLPPVAPLSTQVPAVATEVRPVPTAAIAWLLAGVALFLTAGLLPDRAVSPHGREVPLGMRLAARLGLGALGLTGILVGFVMIIAAA